jgi:LysR family transcriptional regulator, hydrogen peroxide-inducible genes activator
MGMSTFLPTIKQLQYLVALKDHGHFGRAATACYVTQSTLSAGVRELESLLGVTIVERTRRVVRFTALGERIVGKARRVVREAEELGDMVKAAGKPLSGEMRMSVIPTIAPFLLPRILPLLREDWPDLKLFLREETSAGACDSLARGNVDCVLLAMPFACGDVEAMPLFDDALYVAYPFGDNPPDIVEPAMIEQNRLLLLEDGHCLKDHALSACNRPELRADAQMLGTSLHTLIQMVDNGLGLTIIPQMSIDSGLLNGTRTIARPLSAEKASRTISLVWRKASPRGKEFELFGEVLRKANHRAR